jgi:hypothetical protein
MEGKELTRHKEIDLEIKDFLWEILRNWRVVGICAIVGAVLLCGYQYVSDLKAAKATPEENVIQQQESLEEMEAALGSQDMDEVLGAVALKKQLDEKCAYVKESELMQINPYEESVVYLHYYVGAAGENAASIAAVYQNYIGNGGIDSELVDIVKDSDTLYMISDEETFTFEEGNRVNSNSFVVRVRGLSQDQCDQLADSVKENLEKYSETLISQLPSHELLLLASISDTVVDQKLANLQDQVACNIKKLNNNLDSVKSNMTGNQLALYVEYTEPKESEPVVDEDAAADSLTTEVKVNISKTKILIGAMIGLVLAVFYCLLRFLFSARLRSAEEIKTLYCTNVLGNVRSKLNGTYSAVDRWILRSRYHHAGELSLEEELEIISANIKVACQPVENKKVYLTGSAMAEIPEQLIEKLMQECRERGIILVKGKEICYYADALENLAEIGQVIFIERIRGSFYEEMYQEINLCREHHLPVLGMIVLGV